MPLIFVVDAAIERAWRTRYTLEQAGYLVEVFGSPQALELVERELPDLFLIAVKLPDGSGIDLCRRLQTSHTPGKPRIILVAENREDRYRAVVESEVDDFIVSPFAPDEMLSCVRGVLHHPAPVAPSASWPGVADISIDSSAMRVKVRGTEISTTTLEFHLINYMARRRGKVLTRDALLDAVWGDLQSLAPRSVDACIGRIRRKMEPDPFSATYLKTIRGVGYRLDATVVWEATSTELCECVSCSLARARSGTPSIMPRRRIAT